MGQPINDVDKFIRFYESDFGKLILEKETEYIRKEFKDCNKILDIECGVGVYEKRLSELDITVLDISENIIIEARKRSEKKFVIVDAEDLEFDDPSFGCVLCVVTLESISY